MGRESKEPWFRTARNTWYVEIDGRQIPLAKGHTNRKAATRRFHELMIEKGQDREKATGPLLVGRLIMDYLADMKRRRQSDEVEQQTKADAERRLAGFIELHGDVIADQIKPHHVDSWLATKATWGKTSRHDGVGAVKSAFRWAARKGHIERNPLAEMEKPKRKPKRDKIPAPAALAAAFAGIVSPEFADIWTFIQDTGCRPKEARTLEAKHLNLAEGIAVLDDHKTARKTGEVRKIFLAGRAMEVASRLAAIHPTKPIFRNAKGKPWTKDALVMAVRRLKDRIKRESARRGEPAPDLDSLVSYSLRHNFATNALAKKIPAALVAELMGHKDLRMMATYSHISDRHDTLREAAEQAAGNDNITSPSPPASTSPSPDESAG